MVSRFLAAFATIAAFTACSGNAQSVSGAAAKTEISLSAEKYEHYTKMCVKYYKDTKCVEQIGMWLSLSLISELPKHSILLLKEEKLPVSFELINRYLYNQVNLRFYSRDMSVKYPRLFQ